MTNDKASMKNRGLDKIRVRGKVPVSDKDGLDQRECVDVIQNSSLGRWCLLQGETILIPKISEAEQQPLVKLVEEILAAKNQDVQADTEELEREIDRLVYDLYGLTEEEITAVERSLGLIHQTDEEEDEALARLMEAQPPYGPEDFVSREEVMRALRAVDGN